MATLILPFSRRPDAARVVFVAVFPFFGGTFFSAPSVNNSRSNMPSAFEAASLNWRPGCFVPALICER